MSFIELFNYVILIYFIGMELQLLFVSVVSFFSLRRDQFTSAHGRLHDMLTSDTTPPVSIIIPAYNEAAGITESVRSIAMLKYTRKEIIVVNDGSSDDTVQRMIDEFRMEPIDVPFRPSRRRSSTASTSHGSRSPSFWWTRRMAAKATRSMPASTSPSIPM